MRRILAIGAFASWLCFAADATAQEWARKMFDSLEHDFGTVARGAEAEHRFTFTNIYVEDVVVESVKSSCGCATPKITKQRLKTYEKADVVTVYNSRSFLGAKHATITVRFSQPYPAEVQLRVDGYIRGDVVVSPGSAQFHTVERGRPVQKTLQIDYAGRNDWAIVDVLATNPHLHVDLMETRRGGGQVGYKMVVELDEQTPPGYVKDQLTVVTNDSSAKKFPIEVTAKVNASVTVSPSPLFLGTLRPGEKVTKRIVVRGKEPFRILKVECDNDCFSFEPGEGSKPLHLLPVTFVADQTGKVTGAIHIETDLGEGAVPDVVAHAEVAQ